MEKMQTIYGGGVLTSGLGLSHGYEEKKEEEKYEDSEYDLYPEEVRKVIIMENVYRSKISHGYNDNDLDDSDNNLQMYGSPFMKNDLWINVFQNQSLFHFEGLLSEEIEIPSLFNKKHNSRDKDSMIGTSSIIGSFDSFQKRFDLFTNGLLKGMIWNNVICAGGAILACLVPESHFDIEDYQGSDIDLFLYGISDPNQASDKIREIYEMVKKNCTDCVVLRTEKAITICGEYPYRNVQIVLKLNIKAIDVLLGFDVDCCTVGYTGQDVLCSKRAVWALNRRINYGDSKQLSLSYEYRLRKYARRGFSILVPGYRPQDINAKLFECNVWDPEIFGLAKLVLYDHLENNLSMKEERKRNFDWQRKVRSNVLKNVDGHSKFKLTNSHNRQFSYTKEKFEEHSDRYLRSKEISSDYSEIYIPWGPNWRMRNLQFYLNLKDRAALFRNWKTEKKMGRQQPTHKHMFVSGIEAVIFGDPSAFWCNQCKKKVPLANKHLSGPIQWVSSYGSSIYNTTLKFRNASDQEIMKKHWHSCSLLYLPGKHHHQHQHHHQVQQQQQQQQNNDEVYGTPFNYDNNNNFECKMKDMMSKDLLTPSSFYRFGGGSERLEKNNESISTKAKVDIDGICVKLLEFAISLKESSQISEIEKGYLKDLILSENKMVFAAFVTMQNANGGYQYQNQNHLTAQDEFLDTLRRLFKIYHLY